MSRAYILPGLFLSFLAPIAAAQGTAADKSAELQSNLGKAESTLNSAIRGPLNVLLLLYEKEPGLVLGDGNPDNDRPIKNAREMAVTGLAAAKRARSLIEGLNILAKESDRFKKLETVASLIDDVWIAGKGIMTNVVAMKIAPAHKVQRWLSMWSSEEVADPDGWFSKLDTAEAELKNLIANRLNIIAHLYAVAPEAFQKAPCIESDLDDCGDTFIEPKLRCFAMLKELTTRTNLSPKSRTDMIGRVIAYLVRARGQILTMTEQIEMQIALAPETEKLIAEGRARK